MSKVYLNVLLISLVIASGFAGISLVLVEAGAGAVVLPLTVFIATGLVNLSLVFAKRAEPFDGVVSPFNVNAIVAFVGGWTVFITGLGMGIGPYTASLIAALQTVDYQAVANQTIMLLLTGFLAVAISVATAFATRDGDGELPERP